jgi:uncharacterized protein YbbC (DUF1343 family)
MPRPLPLFFAALVGLSACTHIYRRIDDPSELPQSKVKLGISVLLDDSIGLIKGKSIALLANRASVDEKGRTDQTLLGTDLRATKAQVRLAALFAPEHGLSATEDVTNLPSSGGAVPVYSLYADQTVPPPDSALAAVDAVVIDLVDVGTRTWTYEGALVYTMRAAARLKKPVIVLDRPNPITGAVVEGPILDSALANAKDPAPGAPGRAYALYPIPLRHGMTFGELARFYNDMLGLHADLHVIPMRGWRRELWFDRTGLTFVPPSPNLPTLQSVMLYPGLVAFEGTNLSVGRGTATPFQLVGAPWLNPKAVIKALKDQGVNGVRFSEQEFTPAGAGDGKYNGQKIPGIFIQITNRTALQTNRLGAALLSVLHKVHPNDFRVDSAAFDLRFGSPAVRRAILGGENPDAVIDRTFAPAYAFRTAVRQYLLY